MILCIPILAYVVDLLTNPPFFILRTHQATDCLNLEVVDTLKLLHYLLPHCSMVIVLGILMYYVWDYWISDWGEK